MIFFFFLLTDPPPVFLLTIFSPSLSVMAVMRFYSSEAVNGRALQRAAKFYPHLSITTELCYNVELTGQCVTANNLMLWMTKWCTLLYIISSSFVCSSKCVVLLCVAGCKSLTAEQKEVLLWLFRPPLQTEPLSEKSKFTEGSGERLVEIGPRYCSTPTVWWMTCSKYCEPSSNLSAQTNMRSFSHTDIRLLCVEHRSLLQNSRESWPLSSIIVAPYRPDNQIWNPRRSRVQRSYPLGFSIQRHFKGTKNTSVQWVVPHASPLILMLIWPSGWTSPPLGPLMLCPFARVLASLMSHGSSCLAGF